MSAAGGAAACAEYERRKRAWLAAHPEATAEEIETAFRRIADRVGI